MSHMPIYLMDHFTFKKKKKKKELYPAQLFNMVLLETLWSGASRHSSNRFLVFLLWGLADPVKDVNILPVQSCSVTVCCVALALWPATSAALTPVPAAWAGSIHSRIPSTASLGRPIVFISVFLLHNVLVHVPFSGFIHYLLLVIVVNA